MSRSLELSEWMSSGAPEPGPHPRHTPLRALAIRGFHESDHALNFSGLFRGNFFREQSPVKIHRDGCKLLDSSSCFSHTVSGSSPVSL